MEKISQIKKIFFTVLALNIVAIIIYAGMFLMIKIKNEHISSMLNDADRDIKRDEFLLKTRLILNDNAESISKLDEYFVQRDEAPRFIESIENLARSLGVDLNVAFVSVEAETRNKDDFKELLKMRVEVVGSWGRVMTFISALENLPFRILVQSVNVSSEKTQEDLFFENAQGASSWKGNIEFSVLKIK